MISFRDKLINKLKNCPEGRAGWRDYENICTDILNHLFIPPLSDPIVQSRTESGIDIRDALYPNRCEHHKWKFIRDDYNAKYILFEFKNYSTSDGGNNIDKEVVNQVRNYLNERIGRIAFVCSKKEPTSSGIEARKQAYINDKKLIIFLNNNHLIEMLKRKNRHEEPADIIWTLIDKFNLYFG
jgi:hypothetical protein